MRVYVALGMAAAVMAGAAMGQATVAGMPGPDYNRAVEADYGVDEPENPAFSCDASPYSCAAEQ